MDSQLTNIATSIGNYNSVPTSLTSEAVVVSMVSGLTLTKEADKSSWADGVLTYTITINNQASVAYTSPVVTDVLDDTLVDLVNDSVTIDGKAATSSEYQYNTDTHTLTVTLADVAPSSSSVVKFQVKKKTA